MPKIKFSHIVSCSSEDPGNPADNLLDSDPKKKFLCKTKGESSVSIIIQLEKTSKICSIDIGNANSAFVEIFVGRSSSQNQDFEIILPMSSFMTPMDAMNLTNGNRVRLFTTDDLSSAKDEKWDRVKIICTQPFNKNIQFGLSFIALNEKQEENSTSATETNLGKFKIRPESPNLPLTGSLFSKRKETPQTPETKNLVREIRTADTVTPSVKVSIKPGSSKKRAPETDTDIKKQMNRNQRNIFLDSDDDENNDNNKNSNNKNVDIKKKSPERKRKATTSDENKKRQKKIVKKPFGELLSDVVFTISGFVNPERGQIRQCGLDMGAKYRKDWDATCTHLICAFTNTPKFQQVKGKGKIIRKDWLQDCHQQRKRLPWRRYALDKADASKPESEDEIHELLNEPETTTVLSGSDTDEEISKILTKNKNNNKNKKQDEEFCIDTDEEILEKNSKNISDIPEIFKTEIFYIDPVFTEKETELLERLIKSFNGVVTNRKSSIVDFVITNQESFEEKFKNDDFGAKFVTKNWILECHDQMVLVPYDKYLLM